jgi:hypothetical protein
MEADANIAVAWGSPGGAVGDIAEAIEELSGRRPRIVRLGDLAGPNETIQILLTPDAWPPVAKVVAAIYGAELVKEAAKATWKNAAPKVADLASMTQNAFVRLADGISAAIRRQAPVVLGLPHTPVHGRRHVGIELVADDRYEDVARVISILAEHGAEVQARLQEWDQARAQQSVAYTENSDCSVKLYLLDDGTLQMQATVSDDHFRTREVVLWDLYKP